MATNLSTSDAVTLGLRGAISGAAAWGAIVVARRFGLRAEEVLAGFQLGALPIFPGLAFGLIVGAYFVTRGRLAGARLVAYCLASTLAYLVAYHVAYHVVERAGLDGVGGLAAAGIAAGLAGSALLALLAAPLLRVPVAALRRSIAVGTVAGVLLPLFTMGDVGGIAVGPLAFFVLWQGAYAASLAPAAQAAT